MKNLIIFIGIVLLAFNTLIGLIISGYEPFNYLSADASIILSTGLIYFLATGKIDDGLKIGLSVLFSITGMARTVCCIVLPQSSENNVLLIAAVGILLFEIGCFAVASFANKNG
ncbi:MAG: hypothetical protein LBP63_06775 [Prevotellaceae bacterium]|jgi:hypothetical protein|nr:hypothetical protein [Prevotellaceae bacterium]